MSAKTESQPQMGEAEDIYKKRRQTGSVGSNFTGLCRAATHIGEGFSAAAGSGFKEFRESLSPDNINAISPENGVVAGSVAGSAKFFEGIAKALRDALQEAQSGWSQSKESSSRDIDYEKLADMVAERIKKAEKAH